MRLFRGGGIRMISGQTGIYRTEDGDTVAAHCCGSAGMRQGGIIVYAPPCRIIVPIPRAIRRTDC